MQDIISGVEKVGAQAGVGRSSKRFKLPPVGDEKDLVQKCSRNVGTCQSRGVVGSEYRSSEAASQGRTASALKWAIFIRFKARILTANQNCLRWVEVFLIRASNCLGHTKVKHSHCQMGPRTLTQYALWVKQYLVQ